MKYPEAILPSYFIDMIYIHSDMNLRKKEEAAETASSLS